MEGDDDGFEMREEVDERMDSLGLIPWPSRGVVGLLGVFRKVDLACCTEEREKRGYSIHYQKWKSKNNKNFAIKSFDENNKRITRQKIILITIVHI